MKQFASIARLLFVLTSAVGPILSLQAADLVDFQAEILPILEQHCVRCHGSEKSSGRMRLDSADELRRTADSDTELLVAGKPEASEFYQRLMLHATSPKRMPKGADPLPAEAIALIGKWIEQGAVLAVASASRQASDTDGAQNSSAAAATSAAVELLPDIPPASREAIGRLTDAGAQVVPLTADSPLLQVSFAHLGRPASDSDVALVTDIAPQVFALNLSGSQATAAGFATLSALKNLRTLHLERSAVTDESLVNVAQLSNLHYLNLYATSISDTGLKRLTTLKQLRAVYLWQTKVSYDAAMALEHDIPGLIVNLGYSHPQVVRKRLTAEVASVEKRIAEANGVEQAVSEQLAAAQSDVKTLSERLTQLQQELTQLDIGTPGELNED